MRRIIAFASLMAISAINGAYLGKNEYGLDMFSVDLDLPEHQRFVETTAFFKEPLNEVLNQYKNLVPPIMMTLIDGFAGRIAKIQPEYHKEIEGMAHVLGISSDDLLLAQYINELSAFCTSVLAYQPDGTIFHSRNMDFLFAPTMRKIAYQGEFYKNGQHQYTAVMYAGLNSVPTGRREEYSISINNRKPSNRTSPAELLENIGLIFMGFTQNMKLIRDTLQECSTYDCAFKKLAYTAQIAPSYFAIAGSKDKQGAIITKDRLGPAHIEYLSEENWYVSQTNDDHWTGICTLRCEYVRDSMNAIGRDNITPDKLRNILLQWPSNNEHSIYNALMIPSKGFFEVQTIENDKPAPI